MVLVIYNNVSSISNCCNFSWTWPWTKSRTTIIVQSCSNTRIVDELNIPVLAFGIRTDFQGNLFEGSKFLLAWADNLKEIKTVCHCGRKATMVLRLNEDGTIVSDGSQIEIGGEEKYVSVCRKHFQEKNIGTS